MSWVIAIIVLLTIAKPCQFVITFPNPGDSSHGVLSSSREYSLHLGLKVLQHLDEANAVISPVSLFNSLWLLYSGAKGDTKMELENIIGSMGSITSSHLPDVLIANAVFVDNSTPIKQEYLLSGEKSVYSINFTDSEATTSTINSWVSEKTKSAIPELFSEPIDKSTLAMAISALYFNSSWLHPFSPAASKMGAFHVSNNESVQVEFMTREAKLPVYRAQSFNIVGLPYSNNGFTLYILIPHAKGERALKSMVRHLTAETLISIEKSLVEEPTIVTIPKFTLDFRSHLKHVLQTLGVNKMFDPNWADFGDLVEIEENSPKMFVSEVVQSVHLVVNEGGTVGAAATAAVLTKSSRHNFRADRPFGFLIKHSSGPVLFVGTYTSPVKHL